MFKPSENDGRITRRDALRRAVVFSSGMLAAEPLGRLYAGPPQTNFSGAGMHLLALGDYGTRGDRGQAAVARQMATFAGSLDKPLDAVLALGDNFYRKITPDRFEKHFEQMYAAEHLACPFYACLGNHDYGTAKYDFQEGKLQLQLDYAKNHPQSRWKLPAKWYTVELPSPKRPLVKMIVLDGNYWEGGLTPQEKIAQKRFLEAELKRESRAAWTWVVNHFPMFSETSDRGDNKALIRDWGKLIQQYPVSLFFAGHDHTLQHLQVEGFSTSFIVSGAGGAGLYDIEPSKRGFANNRHLGFNHLFVTRERIDVQYINVDGECLHAFHRHQDGQVEVV
jgi:tartrate-resistant acid phosphatase type 5